MKGIAKHSMEYVDPIGLKRWYGLELEFDQTSKHPLDAMAEVESLVKQAVIKSGGQPTIDTGLPTVPPIIQVKPEDREVGVTVESIMSCHDLKTLDTYKLLVRGKGKEHLQEAFNRRENQIIQLTTK